MNDTGKDERVGDTITVTLTIPPQSWAKLEVSTVETVRYTLQQIMDAEDIGIDSYGLKFYRKV
jgi:hypothetical protein